MSAKMDITERLCGYTQDLELSLFPEAVIERAKRAFLDTTGVLIAGLRQPTPAILARALNAGYNPDPSGSSNSCASEGFPLLDKACFFGLAAHSIEFDDIWAGMPGHPSVVLIPLILVLGGRLHINGKAAVEAYLAGLEIQARLSEMLMPLHHQRGFHSTSTTGVMGAAMASARMYGLDSEKTRTAMGIAASMASGLKRSFGTYTKQLHVGLAARNGIFSALLAREGLTADRSILDGSDGYLSVFHGEPERAAEVLQKLGKVHALENPGLVVKKYPMCYATHQGVDAALEIRRVHGIDPAEIERIECLTSEISYDSLPFAYPIDSYQARFCMPYALAVSFLKGRVALADFDRKNLENNAIRGLAGRVRFRIHPELAGKTGFGFTSVRVVGKDGRQYEQRALPSAEERLENWPYGRLREKFIGSAADSLSDASIDGILDSIEHLEKMDDIAELTLRACGKA